MNGGTLKSMVQKQMLQNPTPLYSDAAGLDMCLQVQAPVRARAFLHTAWRSVPTITTTSLRRSRAACATCTWRSPWSSTAT